MVFVKVKVFVGGSKTLVAAPAKPFANTTTVRAVVDKAVEVACRDVFVCADCSRPRCIFAQLADDYAAHKKRKAAEDDLDNLDKASVRVPTKTQKLDLALDDDGDGDAKVSQSEEESSSDEPPDSDMDSD